MKYKPANFKIKSKHELAGDQPQSVKLLTKGLADGKKDQILFGITGSGKTFSMVNIIERSKRPAIIMVHNKTLAMQLYEEIKELLPENAVEYFVSYYDYYQPEAYVPGKDLYLEKDSAINEQIDLMRHSATRSLFERRDVIIVSSVSCIYGLGTPEEYAESKIEIDLEFQGRKSLIQKLVSLQYERNDFEAKRGNFRVKGNIIDIFASHLSDKGWKIIFESEKIESILEFDSLTAEVIKELERIVIYPNTHYTTSSSSIKRVVEEVKKDLKERQEFFFSQNSLLEAQRIKQRTDYDIEMMLETGMCKGIENYSRYFSGRAKGEAPPTLFEYLPEDAILFVDESHVTVPQIDGMYKGDQKRKANLVDYGFRLPAALDNRPLKFEEWEKLRPQTIYVSATPGKYELGKTNGETVEQIIRPTGLLDPICEIKPASNQIQDLKDEIRKCVQKSQRVLVTALTKKNAEAITDYLLDHKIKATYLHSDIKTLERSEIIQKLRKAEIDVIVGINLLREGLDIPECALVAILDADQAGFLRSETSLIQIIGRAARNVEGRVILYADKMTDALNYAINETKRRRDMQIEYNKKHGITATQITKAILEDNKIKFSKTIKTKDAKDIQKYEKHIKNLKKQMFKEAKNFNFEKAAKIRDEIKDLEMAVMTQMKDQEY